MVSETQGIEVRGRVIVEVRVVVIDGTILGADIDNVDGTTLGYSIGDGREMGYLHWPNRLRRSVIALSWLL